MAPKKRLFRMCKIMLILSGLWVQNANKGSTFCHCFYKIYSIGGQILYSTCLICFGVAMYFDFGVKITQVLESFSRMTFVTLIVCKMRLVQSKKMQVIINMVFKEEIKIIKSKDRIVREIYRSHVGYCKIMIFWIVIFLYAAGIINMQEGFYHLYKWKKSITSLNETTAKPQAVPFWFPFDKDKHYYLAMTYQVCHIVQTLLINGAIQALMNSVMVFLRANLKILQHQVRNFDLGIKIELENIDPDKMAYRKFRRLVIRHQELIRWVDDFNDSFKNILLLEYCVTSMQLATTLIQILQSSAGLSQAIYHSNWYNQNKQTNTLINFMLMRCSKPLVMSIGPLGHMNVNAAVSRVKLAYTCMSVLQVTTVGQQ